MIVTKYPPKIHTAFNPVIIQIAKETEAKALIKISSTAVDILSSREYLNGVATFNISDKLKKMFRDEVSEITLGANKIYQDYNLFVEYSVINGINLNDFLIGGAIVLGDQMALNAVVQIGQSSEINKRGLFLTNFDLLRYYPGYERMLSCLSFETGTTYIRFDGDIFNSVTAKHFSIPITEHFSVEVSNQNTDPFLRDNQGRLITANSGVPIEVWSTAPGFVQNMKTIETQIPSSPFYVKWINQQGGWDYWMFSHRQYLSRNSANQVTFNPYIEDQLTAKGFTQLVLVDGIEKVKVGAASLNDNDYDCVSKLIYSPSTQWFNESTGKWNTVLIEPSENTKDTRSTFNDLEFTFLLPTPQLQF
jgi:hypothetical protein